MEDHQENLKSNKGLVRVYITMFSIAFATIVLSIICSEHKESISLFNAYDYVDSNQLAGQFEIVRRISIEEPRFVEGLEFLNDHELLMSSGEYGSSYLDIIDIDQEPLLPKASVSLESKYFGEGITYLPSKGEILMLTYRQRKAFRFSKDLQQLETLDIPREIREGWGMTHEEETLLVSDGTDRVFYVDPSTFQVTSSIQVTVNGKAIRDINELEFVNGKLYANVFQLNDVLKIDLQSGAVEKKYDLSQLLQMEKEFLKQNDIKWSNYDEANNVLNGLAYRQSTDTFFITGKNWHFMYEVKLF